MELAALILLGVKISIAVTVLGIGLGTAPGDATSLFRDPPRLVWSLVAMMVIVPLFAILVARTFDLEPSVKIGLAALSVSPVPPIWPRRSVKFGGEERYTIGLFVATSVLSIVLIPLALSLFGDIFGIPLRMTGSAITSLVFLTVLAPLFTGIEIRRLWPRAAYRHAGLVMTIGVALLLVSAIPILFRLWPAMTSLVGDGTLLTMIAFVLVGLIGGHMLGGPTPEERSVLALACASRHPAIAMAIASANYPNEKLVPAAVVLYLIVSVVASAPYLRWSRRQADRSHRPAMALR